MRFDNTKSIIDKTLAYDRTEEPSSALQIHHETLQLAGEVTGEIQKLIKEDSNDQDHMQRIGTYSSNPTIRRLVGQTLSMRAPTLRSIDPKVINKQVYATLDRLFSIPSTEDVESIERDDQNEFIDSSRINPDLTQLTCLVLNDDLIEELPTNNDFNISPTANLGEIGLITLQDKLKISCDKAYTCKDPEARSELNLLLKAIRHYNPRTLHLSLDTNLILKIFMYELQRGNEQILKDQKEKSIDLLKWSAEILRQFDLKTKPGFADYFTSQISSFQGKNKLKALEAISGTKFTDNSAALNSLSEEMTQVIIDKKAKAKNKFFASRFLVKNTQIASAPSIKKLIQFLDFEDCEESDTAHCSLVILNSWAKEPRLKKHIQDLIIEGIHEILSRENLKENFKDLSYKLLVLTPLLEDPSELIKIYTEHHQNIDIENKLYLATAIARFPNHHTLIEAQVTDHQVKESLDSNLTKIKAMLKNDPDALEEAPNLTTMHILFNSSLEELIKQNLKNGSIDFESFIKIMEEDNSIDTLGKLLQEIEPKKIDFQALICTLLARVIDIDEFQDTNDLDEWDMETSLARLANKSGNSQEEINSTIKQILEFSKRLHGIKTSAKTKGQLENTIISGLYEIGSKAEPYLLEIVEEANRFPQDPIKQLQGTLAEETLHQRQYLPEKSFAMGA